MSKQRVLNGECEIEKVCRMHFDKKISVSMIARHMGASESSIRRVIKENGKQYVGEKQCG